MTLLKLAAVLGLPLAALCQTAVPIPKDPLELVTGNAENVESPEARQAAIDLLKRARTNQVLRGNGHGYDLKVSFKVESGGQTLYDGAWEMEDLFLARLGLRWTAHATAGYRTTQIAAKGLNFGEGTGTLPLRLEEVRAVLFGAVTNTPDRLKFRRAMAMYNGVQVTCYLTEGTVSVPTAGSGRRWDEAEECIDPQTGLLHVHSPVPGRYYAYDYTDALTLGNRVVPREVTVAEGGKAVTVVHVDSLTEISTADASLFEPTKEMTWATTTQEAGKQAVFPGKGTLPPDAIIHPVCVMGIATASGQLTEIHSMQPSDPNSQAAVAFAKTLPFRTPVTPAGGAEQHFEFIIVKFVASSTPAR
jgi:hypothetical protein